MVSMCGVRLGSRLALEIGFQEEKENQKEISKGIKGKIK